jgi:hypothetical protein
VPPANDCAVTSYRPGGDGIEIAHLTSLLNVSPIFSDLSSTSQHSAAFSPYFFLPIVSKSLSYKYLKFFSFFLAFLLMMYYIPYHPQLGNAASL